jgi:ParB family chromosome partitioning protein
MKKNSPRRNIVDAIDFLTEGSLEQQVQDISIDKISEFTDHPFHLYEGKRLEDMVESIKANGVLTPVIVRKTEIGRYQMLAGHNRMNASKLVGLETVPAVVKDNLTDEEAYIYVIETNLMQRSFSDMYPSEKAVVLEMRYRMVTNQGRRTDILNELQSLELGETTDEDKFTDSRGRIGKDYGLSGRTIARLLRLNNLIEEWKLAVDNENIALMTGVEISYISNELQKHLFNECDEMGIKLSLKDAKQLKEMNNSNDLNETEITKYLFSNEKAKIKSKTHQNISVSNKIIDKYFGELANKKEVESVVEKALEEYFKDRG